MMRLSNLFLSLSLSYVFFLGCSAGGSSKPHLDGGTKDGPTTCPSATPTSCSGTCVNTSNNSFNCGSCGHTCSDGQTCQNGSCQGGGCQGGLVQCNTGCTDTSVDNNNCGFCNNRCPTGQSCSNSTCTGGGGNLGCVGIINCFGTCGQGDMTCLNNCVMMGSPTGQQALNDLSMCLFGDGTTTMGACGTACAGSTSACQSCQQMADGTNGACATQSQACQASGM